MVNDATKMLDQVIAYSVSTNTPFSVHSISVSSCLRADIFEMPRRMDTFVFYNA